MIHELLGIKKNRVNMKDVPGAPEDLKEAVLSADQDAFYAEHMFHDFGELGVAVQDLVRRYQANRNTHKNITTLGMGRKKKKTKRKTHAHTLTFLQPI